MRPHDLGGASSLGEHRRHAVHGGRDVVEVFLVARTQVVQAGLAVGVSAFNGDVSQLDEMTQRNAALVEEAAAAAASMEQQSEGLDAAVAAFKLPGRRDD